MAFGDVEVSVHDAAPAYLYVFSHSSGDAWRYTSWEEDLTFGLNTYTAIPMISGAMVDGSSGSANELEVTMPDDVALARAYPYLPRQGTLQLLVYESHQPGGESDLLWDGPVINRRYEGGLFKLRSVTDAIRIRSERFPRKVYGGLCGAVLGDAQCGVSLAAYTVSTTVVLVDGLEITVASDGGNADDYFKAGRIVHPSDGEYRLIESHVGNVITIRYPFREIASTDAVNLIAGCGRTPAICRDKFSNMANFRGFPRIPKKRMGGWKVLDRLKTWSS